MEDRIQRLEDIQEIHNLMSQHEYLHSALMNKEEFETLFAKNSPGLTLEPEGWGVWEGAEKIKAAYADGMTDLGPGMMIEHATTTPVIEVADDGRTAKGVWISPGHETFPQADGTPVPHWSWGRYGIDFTKEDGKWKFWHFHIYTTFRTPYDHDWVATSIDRSLTILSKDDELPTEGSRIPSNKPSIDRGTTFNQPYSVNAVPALQPEPPVPYATWSDTWSYTDPPRD
jgi:hypothetical protein